MIRKNNTQGLLADTVQTLIAFNLYAAYDTTTRTHGDVRRLANGGYHCTCGKGSCLHVAAVVSYRARLAISGTRG
jgi:hypothetical protein